MNKSFSAAIVSITGLVAGGALVSFGCHSVSSGGPTLDMSSTAAAPAPGPIVFTDVSLDAGLPRAASPCLIFRDLDRDGRPDILLATVDNLGQFTGALSFYKNLPTLPFAHHDIQLAGFDQVQSCATADFDNDGWLDLAIVGIKGTASVMAILRNDGTTGFNFLDVTGDAAAPLATVTHATPESVGAMDMDNDGWPDLVIGYIGDFGGGYDCTETADDFYCRPKTPHPGRAPLILHNQQGKGFAVAAAQATQPIYANCVGFTDWDGDGYADLFVSGDFGSNLFLRNTPAMGYSDWLPGWKANPDNHGMGVAIADYNHDGLWDFYSVDVGPDQLYFGEPGGGVENRAAALGIVEATRHHMGWSPLAADFNNDGDVDIFVTNTAVTRNVAEMTAMFGGGGNAMPTDAVQAAYVFANSQGRRFDLTTLPYKGKLEPNSVTGAAAYADFDGDGFVDVAEVVEVRGFVVRLLRNDSPTMNAHYLDVRISAATLNREGLGAVVTLQDGDRELDRRFVGSGGRGISSDVIHFGLGSRTSVPALTVKWPDGLKQAVTGPITADRLLEVKHP